MTILEILDSCNVPYDVSGRGKNRPGWANCLCPHCGRNPYLGIPIEGRAASCWNCGRVSLAESLRLLTGLSAQEIHELIGQLPASNIPQVAKRQRGILKLPMGLGPLLTAHKRYLRIRGFNPDKLKKLWGIQGIGPLGGSLAWRIFIPVFLDGEMVSWTTRRIDNKEPRYHDCKPSESIYPIKDCLYGIDFCRSVVLLVEGPADVWAFGPGAAASLGLRLSPAQTERLSQYSLRLVCFDSGHAEAKARERARRLCFDLSVFDGHTIMVKLESGKDAASCDPQEIESLRQKYLY